MLTAPMHTGATTTATRNELPAWYTQYGQQLTGYGLNIARDNLRDYQGYSTNGIWNPTVAGMSGNESNAYARASMGNIGDWQGTYNTANNTMQGALGQIGAAGSNFNSAGQYIGNATGNFNSATGAINSGTGNFNTADKLYGSATGMYGNAASTLGGAKGVINQGTGMLGNAGGALSWAQQNLNPAQANATAGGTTLAGNAQNQAQLEAYLNPYRTNVADEIARMANMNLTENVIPELNTTFTGNGQFGSTRNADFMNRALRDNQQTVTGAQAQVLMAAMNEASKNYGLEKDRQLQSGQVLGALSQIGGQLGDSWINATNANTNIGQALNQNAGLYTDIGRAQTDTGLASTQTGNARVNQGLAHKSVGDSIVNQGAAMTDLGNARVNQGTATGNIGYQQGQLGQMRNAAAMNDLNAMLTTGGVDRDIRQKQLDMNLALWQDWRDHPIKTVGALSQVLPNVSTRIQPDAISSTGFIAQQPDVYRNLQEIINAINGRS